MDSRLNKARAAFTKLNKVWNSNQISKKTKIKWYKSIVRPVLLYGCETWKIIKSDERKLGTFQFKCVKRIMRIFWPNIVSIDELNKVTQSYRINQEVKKRRWKWIDHLLRKSRNHHCMIAFTWHPDGRGKVGRPKTTWRRTVEKERNEGGWTWNVARGYASDRKQWKTNVEALRRG